MVVFKAGLQNSETFNSSHKSVWITLMSGLEHITCHDSLLIKDGQKEIYIIFFCLFFRAAFVAYGGFQAKGRIRAVAAGLHHSHIRAMSVTHTTAHGNDGSLTHWARPGSNLHPYGCWSDSLLLSHDGNSSVFIYVVFLQKETCFQIPFFWFYRSL